ncbi:PREDICTED: RNA-binding protein 25 isoform X2 [Ipomoea nil]|uniref:RNA-binding protein 25 isoform X2 n=1 Tax=Ipomoea nil TaxID=35883 RepID=UPI00090160E6|nr:PREDICTED: RNA-binding protein 25 isoform X2 [Ipomoea nil]
MLQYRMVIQACLSLFTKVAPILQRTMLTTECSLPFYPKVICCSAGILRYPSPYPMVRQIYPPRPPIGVGIVPPLMRPPVPVIRGPIIPPVIRPAPSPLVTQTEKTHITVYVGKISPTVENDFMLSLLQLCGPVKSWKRVQDPTNGTLKGFGLCEFESAEGVLRALRLLSKLSIDGQELMLNVNQATKKYLEQYVKKKIESSTKPKDQEDTGGADKGEENVSDAEKSEASKTASEHPEPTPEDSNKDNEKENKENHDTSTFGLVTDEDRQADQEASEKLTDMIKERIKNKPLPPPPPPPQLLPTDAGGNLNVENHSRSKDGESDADAVKNEVKNEDDLTSESKPSSEHDREGTSSPDRRRHDRSSRDRDRDIKREKERELERYEREREQERAKREKEREYKIRDDERRYKVREKEWESREREKEHWRKREREREKERAHERKLEIMEQEHDGDDGYKRRKYRSSDEERKRRHREKEDDLADRLKEEEEIAEAKQRDDEQQRKKEQEEALRILSGHVANGHDRAVSPEKNNREDKSVVITSDLNLSHSEALAHNSIGDESMWAATAASDTRQNSNAPAKKLGFGLQGSGKRAAVPSVFNEDEDEDMQKEKKMRPLVPIDYSIEEPVVHPSISEAPYLISTTAIETAKRISNVNSKEDRLDAEKDRSRRSHERSSHRERERHDEESRKENVDHDRAREHRPEKTRTPDNQKLLDAKQLIDMIPKTKNELFSYEINWAIYDKNELHERMRPWIAKKITEFLGEEEPTLVDYIVSSTQEHVKAAEMLERLQAILDEEAEMFVLKMWRMLIFEVKKVETGLASRSKS